MEKNVIRVQKEPEKDSSKKRDTVLEMACRIAYHYPQYKPEDVMNINIKMQRRLLKIANSIHASRMHQLTTILEATSTPYKGRDKQVSKILEYYEAQI